MTAPTEGRCSLLLPSRVRCPRVPFFPTRRLLGFSVCLDRFGSVACQNPMGMVSTEKSNATEMQFDVLRKRRVVTILPIA